MTMNLWKCANVDTLAAIAGPMAYAYYKKMPDALVYQAQKKLPEWMVDVSERFDELMNNCINTVPGPVLPYSYNAFYLFYIIIPIFQTIFQILKHFQVFCICLLRIDLFALRVISSIHLSDMSFHFLV